VLALAEHGLDGAGVEVRVEFGTGRPGDAVRGPGRGVVRVLGEVFPGVDVEVLRSDHAGVAVVRR
jgi:hypothetical protein